MNRVRLGRALGYGTRHAAKTVAALVEAAADPGPQHNARVQQTPHGRPGSSPAGRPRSKPASAGLAAGARNLKRSFWHPLAVFSGALWLRVTGLFFALIAISMAAGAWRLRSSLSAGASSTVPHRMWAYALFAVLFGYFAISSFVRATWKERRAAKAAT